MEENVFLDLTLQFKKGEAWSNVYEFDRDFAKFLATLNLEGRVIEPIKGMPGRKLIYIGMMKKDLLQAPGQNWEKGKKK